jgi:hypothetical protein
MIFLNMPDSLLDLISKDGLVPIPGTGFGGPALFQDRLRILGIGYFHGTRTELEIPRFQHLSNPGDQPGGVLP